MRKSQTCFQCDQRWSFPTKVVVFNPKRSAKIAGGRWSFFGRFGDFLWSFVVVFGFVVATPLIPSFSGTFGGIFLLKYLLPLKFSWPAIAGIQFFPCT